MFINNDLKTAIEQSPTLETRSVILSEINMNSADKISVIGNYRYRPTKATFTTLPSSFVKEDALTPLANQKYFNATDSSVETSVLDEEGNPLSVFESIQSTKKMLYSLDDCFKRFRPRSGINKAMYYGDPGGTATGHYLHNVSMEMMDI